MEVTLINCRNVEKLHVKNGIIDEGEGGEVIDCKGLPVRTLNCTIALRPAGDLDSLASDPVPPPEFVDSLLLGGVGLVLAPKGTKSGIVEVIERPFVLDPMLPPEEVPEEGAVVLRSVLPEHSFGYKEKYGEWPIRHLGEKAKNNIIMDAFWCTTWEAQLIELPAFRPELPAAIGVSSPIPPELSKAIYSPYSPRGPEFLKKLATTLMRSHYWSGELVAEHADEACWTFAGREPPRLKRGSKALLWVGEEEAEFVILGDKIIFREDLIELRSLDLPFL